MQFKEGELVPITPLENDAAVNHMKEAATTQSERIAPFQDCPLPIFKNVFYNANHFDPRELLDEPCADRSSPLHSAFSDLMIARTFGVQRRQGVCICPVERLDPELHHVLRGHHFSH